MSFMQYSGVSSQQKSVLLCCALLSNVMLLPCAPAAAVAVLPCCCCGCAALLLPAPRDLGERQAANLADKYKTMKALQLAANSSTATSSKGEPEIPGQLGASLGAWFAEASNKLLLNELRNAGG
jgi:hypothetical protein